MAFFPRAFLVACLGIALLLLGSSVQARGNTPCSGSKGGIERCTGDSFLCRDGSISASKRSCIAYTGGAAGVPRGLMAAPPPKAASGDCSCRSGAVCTGPRGGRYCINDRGNKSYLRR